MIGVPEERFMDSCPVDMKPYDRMYQKRKEEENFMAYLQGIYFADALSATVGNMFKKRGAKLIEYPQEPHRITPYTEEEKEQMQKQALQNAIRYFDALTEQSKKFNKQDG